MSLDLMRAVWNIRKLALAEKVVLLSLCDFADDQGGSCFPFVATLARRCSMTEHCVFEQLKKLEASGYITRNQRAHRSTDYKIHWAVLRQMTVDNSTDSVDNFQSEVIVDHPDLIHDHPRPDPRSPISTIEPPVNLREQKKQKTKQPDSEQPDSEQPSFKKPRDVSNDARVPGPINGRDPALLKLDEDDKRRAPIPAAVLAEMEAIRKRAKEAADAKHAKRQQNARMEVRDADSRQGQGQSASPPEGG